MIDPIVRCAAIALAVLAGCQHTPPSSSQPDAPAGDPCPTEFNGDLGGSSCTVASDQLCFVKNTFSSCYSGWYRCVGGVFQLDHSLGATDGGSCAGSPFASCEFEGYPNCSQGPASQACTCDPQTGWHCDCSCYDGTSCPTCPAEYSAAVPGTTCGPVGNTCNFSQHTCTCSSNGSGDAPTFHCT